MMHPAWTITAAQENLDELLDRAELAPQIVNRRGRQFVVLDGGEYRRLTEASPDLKDLILNGPSLEGLDLERDKSGPRV